LTKLAAVEAPPAWYDKIYTRGSRGEEYVQPIHDWIGARVYKSHVLLDLGCGPGQFADHLINLGYFGRCVGVDFSDVAMRRARESWCLSSEARDAPGKYMFVKADIRRWAQFKGVDTVVLCETLEHIFKDRDLLSRIPRGTRVVGSVPTFGGRNCHVRSFPSLASVVRRYGDLLDFLEIVKVAKSWCFVSYAL